LGKIKSFFKKDIDLGLAISVLFTLVLGIYKLFFQTTNRGYSKIFGLILIVSVFVYLAVKIRNMLKKK
jgi:hypothetical protein